MKVLVISLLRIGDLLLCLPTVNGLKKQSGITRVDLLTFKPAAQMKDMVGVDQWWTLNRDDLQAGLGRADIPLLTSYSVLKESLDRINLENYDYIVNLTQTEFSAWVAGYLNARSYAGLVKNVRGEAEFHSPWFRYLNDRPNSADIFHYSDIFFHGAGLSGPERDWTLRETPAGRTEAAAFRGENLVAIQALTSDPKKNWQAWAPMLETLQRLRPELEFVMLGAPSEREQIDELTRAVVANGVRAQTAILSLAGAYSLLKKSKLLISGDTSIKHLANAAKVPTIELSLGSSDLRRTGIYQADALILQPTVECAPCTHSSACSRATHECGAQISPALVASAASAYLAKDWNKLTAFAHEPNGKLRWLKTLELSNGFWLPRDLHSARNEMTLQTLIERSSWKFLLTGEHLKMLAGYGSESLNLQGELSRLFTNEERPALNLHLNFLESESEKVTSHLEALLAQSRTLRGTHAGEVTEIGELRRQQNQIENSANHARIQMKMIKTLKSQLMESV